MNTENAPVKKTNTLPVDDFSVDDFDFKPITSGLGFHQPKTTEIKPAFAERTSIPSGPVMSAPSMVKKDMNVYQNDLSLFYGQTTQAPLSHQQTEEVKAEKVFKLATKPQRFFAYILDLSLVTSIVGLVLTVMARTIEMEILEVWSAYPNEITPLVVTLFCGFYMIYFSIFEKASVSTLGKSLLNIRVVNTKNEIQSFPNLLLRSFISLTNFISLGLFSYFDLQNKVTHSKVIRND